MKLKQVTFAEALEHMLAGNYAYPNSAIDHPYRVVSREIQHRRSNGTWGRSMTAVQCAMDDWFVEVETMKATYEAKTDSVGSLSYHALGDGWEHKSVRVTVEEL
jgi:hypothetical protein